MPREDTPGFEETPSVDEPPLGTEASDFPDGHLEATDGDPERVSAHAAALEPEEPYQPLPQDVGPQASTTIRPSYTRFSPMRVLDRGVRWRS